MTSSIILADDDKDWLFLMQHLLKEENVVHVSTSINGEDIWQQIDIRMPDLIVLDIHMKETSGEFFCHLLKSDPVTSGIPVLLFSADYDIDVVAERCGADGYISKSTDLKEVKKSVLAFLDH